MAEETRSRFGGVPDKDVPVSRFGGVPDVPAVEEIASEEAALEAPVSRFGGVPDEDAFSPSEQALLEKVADYDQYRKLKSAAPRVAEESGEFPSKLRSLASAQFLQGREPAGIDPEDVSGLLETGTPPQLGAPGHAEGFDMFLDTADFLVSPLSRPMFGSLRAHAEALALAKKDPAERLRWINKLHPKDSRKNLFWEISEALTSQADGANPAANLKLEANLAALAGSYWLPGTEPYGMRDLPSPWQEIGDDGRVSGGPSATTTDILARGTIGRLALSEGSIASAFGKKAVLGPVVQAAEFGLKSLGIVPEDFGLPDRQELIESQDVMANAIRSKVQGIAEAFEIPFEAAFGVFTEDGLVKSFKKSSDEAMKVFSGDPDADPNEGSFLPSMLFTISPDIGLDLATRGVRFLKQPAVAGEGGVLTRHGDSRMRVSKEIVSDNVKAQVAKLDATLDGPKATPEEFSYVLDQAKSLVGEAFMRQGVRSEKMVGKHIVEVDVSDAINVTRDELGRLVSKLDESKVRVLMSDDPLVRGATKSAVLRGLDPADRKLLEDAIESIGGKDLSQAKIFGELSDRGFARNVALSGAIAFGAGYIASDEEDLVSWARFYDAMKAGAGGVAGGSIMLGAGRGLGLVVDKTGRRVARVGFKPGTTTLDGVVTEASGPYLGGAPEAIRKSLPGTKRMKPWTQRVTKIVDGVPKTTHKPVEFADFVSDHVYARNAFVEKQERFVRKKLRSQVNAAAHAALKGVNTKEERRIVLDLIENMGDGTMLEDLGTTLVYSLRKHLERAIKYIPDEVTGPESAAKLAKKIAKESDPKRAKALGLKDDLRKATDEVLKVLDEDPFDAVSKITLGHSIRSYAEKAQVISSLMRQIIGVDSPEALKAYRRASKELDDFMKKTDKVHLSDRDFMAAVDRLGAAEAREAAILARKEAYLSDPRYAKLSKNAQQAITGVRQFFDLQYNLLRAEGALPANFSRKRFMFEMGVAGYIPHMLASSSNIAKVSSKIRGKFKDINLDLSTVIDAAKRREIAGPVSKINLTHQRKIAEMIYKETTEGYKKGQKITDEMLDEVVANHKLDKYEFFETDLRRVMADYSGSTSRAVSNRRFLDNLSRMFPESDALAARAKKNRMDADAEAAKLGYRRVDSVVHLRSLLADAPWSGFAEHADAIRKIVRDVAPKDRGAKLFNFLKENSITMGSAADKKAVDVLAQDLYLPELYADMLELSSKTPPEWGSKGIPGYALGSWDAVTNYMKSILTVLAPAFHGRNIISNVVTNLMAHGFKAVSPTNQIDAIQLMRLPDDAVYVLKGQTPSGSKFQVEKTAKEWREELVENGISIDDLDLSDSIRSGRAPRHTRTSFVSDGKFQAPAYTAAAGSVIGGYGGYTSEPADGRTLTDQERLQRAVAGVMFGGLFGMAGGGVIDLFVKEPSAAALSAMKSGENVSALGLMARPDLWKNVRPALSAGFDEWIDIIGGASKESFVKSILSTEAAKAGFGMGVATGVAAAFVPGENVDASDRLLNGLTTGVVAALFGASTKGFADGAFILSGGIGRKIEEQAKIVNYLAGRKAGMTASGAAEIVHKTLFDYDDLSRFERYVLRRIFPFYTWTSKNATELQPWLLQNRPLAYSALTKAVDALDSGFELEEDKRLLDPHLKYRAVVASGLGRVVAGLGLPQEDLVGLAKGIAIGEPFAGMVSYSHPYIQLLYKFVLKRDPYYLSDLDRVRGGGDVRYLLPGLQRYVGYHEKTRKVMVRGKEKEYTSYQIGKYFDQNGAPVYDYPTAARRMAIYKGIGISRMVSEFTKILTPSFLSGLHGAEEGAEATSIERFFATMTGAKPYGVDIRPGGLSEERLFRALDELYGEAIQEQMGIGYKLNVLPKKLPMDSEEEVFLRELGIID